jgi:hypothetical protein
LASQSIGLRRHRKPQGAYVSFTADPVAIRDRGVAVAAHAPTEAAFVFMHFGVFGIRTLIHQVPFLHAHPNGR